MYVQAMLLTWSVSSQTGILTLDFFAWLCEDKKVSIKSV